MSHATAQAALFRPKTRIGFNTRVSFNDDEGPARGLRDGIELFKAAERLGYQSGWCYQRHFDHYLSSPLPFFAAAGQHTRHIALGSATIPMRYQDPILFAEAVATTDLLVDGRLQLAISTGVNTIFDAVFGPAQRESRAEAKYRQARFLTAISGDVVHTVNGPGQGAPEGTELRATPFSPTLRTRIRQGSGSLESAIHAAEIGIGLITGTVLHGHAEGESFWDYQARCIAAYRNTWHARWGGPPPPVAVAASVLVGTTPGLRESYAAYDLERRTHGIAASRPKGAIRPAATVTQPPGAQISPVFHGTPDEVTEAVLRDPGLSAADEIVLFLPPGFGLSDNLRILADFRDHVARNLGWAADW